MENKQHELIGYVHQNAKMGTETITELIKMTSDIPFRQTLENQLNQYQAIIDEAESISQSRGCQPLKVPLTSELSTNIMLKMNTLTDKSTGNMAKMLIQGSTMGVVEMTKHLREITDADEQTKNLANRLLQTEQANIDTMKSFL